MRTARTAAGAVLAIALGLVAAWGIWERSRNSFPVRDTGHEVSVQLLTKPEAVAASLMAQAMQESQLAFRVAAAECHMDAGHSRVLDVTLAGGPDAFVSRYPRVAVLRAVGVALYSVQDEVDLAELHCTVELPGADRAGGITVADFTFDLGTLRRSAEPWSAHSDPLLLCTDGWVSPTLH